MAGKKLVERPKWKDADKLGVSMKGTPTEGQRIELSEEDALKRIFGTEYPQMASRLMGQCLKVLKSDEASDDYPSNDEREFLLSVVAEIQPRDTFERLLSVQMAATHVAMIRSGRWLANSERVDQVQAHYNGYTRLARAYVSQMEALRKHRNGGKQTVTVQHVNVQDGGQAIVGNVGDRGRAHEEK